MSEFPPRRWSHGLLGHHRQAEREIIDCDECEVADPTPTPEERLADAEEGAIAWALVETLPSQERSVLVATYRYDWPVAEIAAVLGVSRWTVLRLRRGALARLRLTLTASRQAPVTRVS